MNWEEKLRRDADELARKAVLERDRQKAADLAKQAEGLKKLKEALKK